MVRQPESAKAASSRKGTDNDMGKVLFMRKP